MIQTLLHITHCVSCVASDGPGKPAAETPSSGKFTRPALAEAKGHKGKWPAIKTPNYWPALAKSTEYRLQRINLLEPQLSAQLWQRLEVTGVNSFQLKPTHKTAGLALKGRWPIRDELAGSWMPFFPSTRWSALDHALNTQLASHRFMTGSATLIWRAFDLEHKTRTPGLIT
eukprot:1151771-Pelagomonas_calceolata.AAC.1